MINSRKSFLNIFFAMVPTTDISGLGVGIVILEQNKKNLKGLKILADGKLSKFGIPYKEFVSLLDNKKIEMVDKNPAPQEVVQEFYDIYKSIK